MSLRGELKVWVRALRLHQWLKNTLVFVPLLAAHRLDDPAALGQAALAFIAMGFCASTVYLTNDLLDLPTDRQHPSKRFRPLAAGELSPRHSLVAIPILACLSVLVALTLPGEFLVSMGLC